ncbi:MAG: metal ABC transporter permease [Alphaproteobacteria bacterium]
MPDFIVNALLAGCGISLMTGPLGSLIVWRRMAFFGDTLAHSAILGIAFSLLMKVDTYIGLIVVPSLTALLLAWSQSNKLLSSDTWLAIAAHGTMAIGIVMIYMVPSANVNISEVLFGDILTVSQTDLMRIGIIAILVLLGLWSTWKAQLAITVDEDLAAASNISVKRTRLVFMLLMALMVGVAIQIIGVLLLTALMVIPSAAARLFSRTPEQMIFCGIGISILSIFAGVFTSLQVDTPTSPTIVVATLIIFALLSLLMPAKHRP